MNDNEPILEKLRKTVLCYVLYLLRSYNPRVALLPISTIQKCTK